VTLKENVREFFQEQNMPRKKRIEYIIINFVLFLVIFYIVLNTIVYDWTGSLYPEGTGFRLDVVFGGVEDAIPFMGGWIIVYWYVFYPMMIFLMLFFIFADSDRGYAVAWSLVIINAAADLVYIFFPVSTFWYRQQLLTQSPGGYWGTIAYQLFTPGSSHYDTSFDCFPSLHAALSTICFYAWYRYAKINPRPWIKAIACITLVLAIGIILSTLFLKQHYILDLIAGITLAWVVGKLLFNHFWKTPTSTPVAG